MSKRLQIHIRILFAGILAISLPAIGADEEQSTAAWVAEQESRELGALQAEERSALMRQALSRLRSVRTAEEATPVLDLIETVANDSVKYLVAGQLGRTHGQLIGKLLPTRLRDLYTVTHTRLAVLMYRLGDTDRAGAWAIKAWEEEATKRKSVTSMELAAEHGGTAISGLFRTATESSVAQVAGFAGRWLATHGDIAAFGTPKLDRYGQLFTIEAPASKWVLPWTTLQGCDVEIFWPSNAPRAQVVAHLKDWDHLWYQVLLPQSVRPGETNIVHVDLRPEAEGWEPRGHHAKWNYRALMEPQEFGLRLLYKTETSARGALISVRGIDYPKERPAPLISNVRRSSDRVRVHERFEVQFELPDRYTNPFATNQVHATLSVEQPDGTRVVVDAFYGQDFYRTVDTSGEDIRPTGAPIWRARFAPQQRGRHQATLRVTDRYGSATRTGVRFEAVSAVKPGYVQVAKRDPRFFEFGNDTPYTPIGHNIRSPFDTRMVRNFPWQQRWMEGTAAYERYFKAMSRHGENFAEIWTAAWSLGLEWSERWPGYHGVGQYNMRHAWELDQVVQNAEAQGIYLNLVIHNHGKYSGFSDEEWEHNPFNVALGGYLKTPDEFFTNERAFQDWEQLLRYMVARWGYSTHIFAWELWSELDLTGAKRGDPMQKRPETVKWHARAANAIRRMDPNDHLITTHVSGDYKVQGKELIRLPEISHCSVDAYHNSKDPLRIVELMNATADFNNPTDKPVLITEFGGSPMASDMDHLRDTLHAGLWASVGIPVAGTPMFWWWMAIEEENLYPTFAAVQRYVKGVDRRDPTLTRTVPGVLISGGPTEQLDVECMSNATQAYGWLYRKNSFSNVDPQGEKVSRDVTLKLPGLERGRYTVEFWDTITGEIVGTANVYVRDEVLAVQVPAFARDIAFKAFPSALSADRNRP